VDDEKNKVSWVQVAKDFAHNTLFSFAVGPFINGMSSAISGKGYWKGVKAVTSSWKGWKFNGELALAVGIVATTFNTLIGRNSKKAEPEVLTGATVNAPLDGAALVANHAAREEARREHAGNASISR
jgi:hypothetical protein